MTKTLTVVGNGLGLVIDQSLLDELHIDRDTPLEVETDGKALIIRPVRGEDRRSRVLQSAERMMDAHDETLKKLAK